MDIEAIMDKIEEEFLFMVPANSTERYQYKSKLTSAARVKRAQTQRLKSTDPEDYPKLNIFLASGAVKREVSLGRTRRLGFIVSVFFHDIGHEDEHGFIDSTTQANNMVEDVDNRFADSTELGGLVDDCEFTNFVTDGDSQNPEAVAIFWFSVEVRV